VDHQIRTADHAFFIHGSDHVRRLTLQARSDSITPQAGSQRSRKDRHVFSHGSHLPGHEQCQQYKDLTRDSCRVPMSSGTTKTAVKANMGKYSTELALPEITRVPIRRCERRRARGAFGVQA